MNWWRKLTGKDNDDQSIGLCLSGGGARGVIHIGLLKALEERNIQYSAVSGTSMGAIVAVMAASGMKAEDILDSFIGLDMGSRVKRWRMVTDAFQKGLNPLYDRLSEVVGVKDFNDLKMPCYLTASELRAGEPVIFSEGDALHAALASASIPLIFSPYEQNDHLFVDGGLFNNFPVDPLIDHCSHIIGSHANHISYEEDMDGLGKIADRVFRLAIFQNVRYRMDLCDLVIDPPKARTYSTLDFEPKVLKELYNIGYEAAQDAFENWDESMSDESSKNAKRLKFKEIIQTEKLGLK